MRAVVLVGGFGTRLRPLTLDRPKQMLPVVGLTMLERVVARLGASGVTEAVLSLGYQPDAFLQAFPDGVCAGVALHYAVEPEPLDTGGAIRFAAEHAGIDDTFLAVNGDVLTDLDLDGLWKAHGAFGGEATIALTPVEDPSRYGVVPLDPDGRVEAFIEKPPADEAPSNWINAGTYVLEPSVLELTAGFGDRVSIERVVFPTLVERRTLFGVQSDAYWIDAGTPESYLEANLDLIDGHRGVVESGVDPTASVHDTAVVEHSVVDAGAQILAGAVVRDSVVMAGASVGEAAELQRVLVGPSAVVGAGARLGGLSVLGTGAVVADGAVMDDERLPGPELWPAT